MTKVLQELPRGKDMEGIERWEEMILGKHLEEARQDAKGFLEWLDDPLREHCPAGWKVVGTRERTLITLFGPVLIQRALYHDPQGKSCFLLDRALGWQPRVQATPALQLLLARLGSEFSYRQVQRILASYCQTPPSHATLQKRVTSLGEALHQEEEETRRQLEKNRALPEQGGRKVASPLFIEADGVSSLSSEPNNGRRRSSWLTPMRGKSRPARDASPCAARRSSPACTRPRTSGAASS